MNVFRATLVFICFVAAKGNFPAVIFRWQYFLAEPTILPLCDTEVEVGFDNARNVLYTACPVDPSQRKTDAFPEVLVQREIVTVEENIYLDELLFCELQPKVSFKQVAQTGEYSQYQIGYKVYRRNKDDEDDNGGSRFYGHTIGVVFTLNFNTVTKTTFSVQYQLEIHSRFIPTASNGKHTLLYEKNEDFLKIDLDSLYENFVHQILPRMVEQKSKNQLAHALGIQKVQLAPRDDFPLDTWKMATYWNINTVPIWRVLLLRWNAIEIYLRKVFKRKIDIKIETGASGTLELTKRYYGNDTNHKLHIPKYVWKLIPDTYPNDKAMLIVMHNDPFTEHQETLCEDICAINGWLVSNDDYRTGLVYCCEMTENIAEILKYPNDMNDWGIHSFTRDTGGTENLEKISRILSDLQNKVYDW